MKLTYYGHSAFRIGIESTRILLDPFLSANPMTDVDPATVDADVILLTHAHWDHWGDTLSIAKRTGALVVGNYEICRYVSEEHGHENVQEMNIGGAWTFPWGRLSMTWARHSSSFPDGTYGGHPGGYMIEAEGKCVYAAGDTSPFMEMAWMGTDFDIDLALLPVGDCFTMGPLDSCRAADMLSPGLVVPIHYNTFPPIEVDILAWKTMMSAAGHDTHVLPPGSELEL